MHIRCEQIVQGLEPLFPRTQGDLQTALDRVAPAERSGPGCLVFAGDAPTLAKALAQGAGAIVLPLKLERLVPAGAPGTFLFTKDVKLAMAFVLQRHFDAKQARFRRTPGIHPSAFVAPDAVLAEGVVVSPGATIGPRAVLGRDVIIGPGCVVEEEAQIGAGTLLHALVFVGWRCRIGERCEIHPHTTIGSDGYAYAQDERHHHHKVPQLGIVVVEDDVEIQANCAIDRAAFDETRIGRGTKIDNLCHIAHNCRIGEHVLLTGGFFVAGSSSLGNHCVTGGRTTVTDHVAICAGVQLGGLSAVTKDVVEPGTYGGYPLQPIKDFLRTTSSLAHLPEMRKRLARLEQVAQDELAAGLRV